MWFYITMFKGLLMMKSVVADDKWGIQVHQWYDHWRFIFIEKKEKTLHCSYDWLQLNSPIHHQQLRSSSWSMENLRGNDWYMRKITPSDWRKWILWENFSEEGEVGLVHRERSINDVRKEGDFLSDNWCEETPFNRILRKGFSKERELLLLLWKWIFTWLLLHSFSSNHYTRYKFVSRRLNNFWNSIYILLMSATVILIMVILAFFCWILMKENVLCRWAFVPWWGARICSKIFFPCHLV